MKQAHHSPEVPIIFGHLWSLLCTRHHPPICLLRDPFFLIAVCYQTPNVALVFFRHTSIPCTPHEPLWTPAHRGVPVLVCTNVSYHRFVCTFLCRKTPRHTTSLCAWGTSSLCSLPFFPPIVLLRPSPLVSVILRPVWRHLLDHCLSSDWFIYSLVTSFLVQLYYITFPSIVELFYKLITIERNCMD